LFLATVKLNTGEEIILSGGQTNSFFVKSWHIFFNSEFCKSLRAFFKKFSLEIQSASKYQLPIRKW